MNVDSGLTANRMLFRSDVLTPLGHLNSAGYLHDSPGVSFSTRRVLGSYAIVYILHGGGRFKDSAGPARRVRAGDLIVVFPELPHAYGPGAGETWDEIFVIFDGPAFDLLRAAGLLNPASPVCRLEPIAFWRAKLAALLEAPRPFTESERLVEVSRFAALLTEMLAANRAEPPHVSRFPWLDEARGLLETDLSNEIDFVEIARRLGVSYETFRKQFQRQIGVSPWRYRTQKRIDAACDLLRNTDMTNKQVADSLGFRDPFHFAKRFKQITRTTPKEYRTGFAVVTSRASTPEG